VWFRVVGLYLEIAVPGALQHRNATGEGQAVEVPMVETMAQFVLADHMGGGAFVPPIGPMGYKRLLSRTRGPYPTADGHLCLVVYTDKHWRDFLRLMGKSELLDTDPRFHDQESRTQNAEFIGQFLAEHLPARSTREWLEVLRSIDIPASAVNSIDDLLTDPHLEAVQFFNEVEHPTEGTLKTARFPIDYSRSPATVRRLAPNLGEHTDEVMNEFGIDALGKNASSNS